MAQSCCCYSGLCELSITLVTLYMHRSNILLSCSVEVCKSRPANKHLLTMPHVLPNYLPVKMQNDIQKGRSLFFKNIGTNENFNRNHSNYFIWNHCQCKPTLQFGDILFLYFVLCELLFYTLNNCIPSALLQLKGTHWIFITLCVSSL